MAATIIRFVLTHVPLIMTVAALLVATATVHGKPNRADHYLGWILLLAVGIDGLWAGLFHVLWPHTAAAFIGWEVSPFQFEVGIADIALGVVAVAAFWRPLEFRTAIALYAALFYVGVACGHVHQAVAAANFAPGNFGVMLGLTVLRAGLLIGLVLVARRAR